MDFELWKKNVRSVVKLLADPEAQRVAWFGRGYTATTWEETLNTLFDDFEFNDFMDEGYNAGKFTRGQYGELEQLRDALDALGDIYDEATDVVLSSKWTEVVEVSQTILDWL